GSRIIDRKWRVCEDSLKDVYIVTRECGHVGCGGKVEVHRIVEKAAVPVDDGFSPAVRIPCETHPRRPVAFRCAVCLLVEGKQRLRGHIEILPLISSGGPHSVVVVPESKVQSEPIIHFPIVLEIEVPVGIAIAHKSWEPDFLQDKYVIVLQIGNNIGALGGVVVRLLWAQPLVVPVNANLRSKFKRVPPDGLAYIVKN